MILLALLILQLYAISIHNTSKEGQKIAVIDAGSSGSRIHIFQLLNGNIIESGSGHRITPGISSVDDYPSYLAPLLDYIAPHGPLPVYVLATAGMRLLDNDVATSKLATIKRHFQQAGMPMVQTRIISGLEEGFYGFLSTLDLSHLNPKQLGFLELGGASLQISYLSKKGIKVHLERDISVYSYSWLNYGINRAKERYASHLTSNHTRCRVPDPCALSSEDQCLVPKLDVDTCKQYLKTLIVTKDCPTLCDPNTPIQLPKDLVWFGASVFHYAVYDTMHTNVIQVDDARRHVENRCRFDKSFGCIDALYTLALLDILKIEKVHIPLKINDRENTWTRGFAVYYFNK